MICIRAFFFTLTVQTYPILIMKRLKCFLVLLPGVLCMTSCSKNSNNAQTNPVQLKCEMRIDPLGIDVTAPRLSWQLESGENGQYQTAYQILVSSDTAILNRDEGDLWNSGKVVSDQSQNIPYAGKELTSGQICFWKVKSWDKKGNGSSWSNPAMFSIGLLDENDWGAQWIGLDKAVGNDDPNSEFTKLSARYMRKGVIITKEIVKATAYICGLGLSEMYINGQKVSDHVLSPGQTQFDKRVLYVTHDVTGLLSQGENAIGVILGGGRLFPMRQSEPFSMEGYGFPKLLLQIDIEYSDGTAERIVSDESWKLTADGPITENNEYDGEKYDARKEMPGWDLPGFDDSGWQPVQLVNAQTEQVSAQMTEPIRITEELTPLSVNEITPGKYIFDMGQNMVGWGRLKVEGKKGTRVKLRFAEALQENGELYMDNIRSAKVTDIYTCKGEGSEVWEPRFTYHGFRFVELTGYPGTPDLSTITGKVVHDDVSLTGSFECNLDMVNRIARNAVWGIRGNYRSFPTDCPQRDERQAWLGDRATGSRGESYIFDISQLYAKWMTDIGDAQLESGSISDVSPAYWKLYNDNVTWAGTPIILADMLYDQYGDFEVISKNYPYLKKWYDYMTDNYLEDGLMPRDSYGDWCMPPAEPELIHSTDPDRITSGTYLGTAFFYHMTGLMEGYARMLDKEEDAAYFGNQAETIRQAFLANYFNDEFCTLSNNTATANILALAFGLVDKKYEQQVFDNLVERIEVQFDGHIPVGLVGAQFLMRTLTQYGRPDIALRFATQSDYPSWGYMAENGATTIWELWNGNTADPAMNSRNHVMLLGDFNIWLYENLGAIKPLEPGFKKIEMKPVLIEGLDFVKAHHVSPYGRISSAWSIEQGTFTWKTDIPVNSTADVYVPATGKKHVMFSSKKDVKFIRGSGDYVLYRVGSGHYEITSDDFAIHAEGGEMTGVVKIKTSQTVDTKPITVEMSCPTPGASIYYTLDGSEPDNTSNLYSESFLVKQTGIIRARAFSEDLGPGFKNAEKVVIYNPEVNGLKYRMYQGKWEQLPDFSKLVPVKEGKVHDISDLESIKTREDYWGLVYEGYIEIVKQGAYHFSLSSDDGSRLIIDGNEVLDNDGIHGIMSRQGSVELSPGKHPVRIEFFEGNYGEHLVMSYSGPGIPEQGVPFSMFFFDE